MYYPCYQELGFGNWRLMNSNEGGKQMIMVSHMESGAKSCINRLPMCQWVPVRVYL
jgi:hypothetical protein